jgi:NADP-dependent 3-hydroxy acid dehydrogenase YdfG
MIESAVAANFTSGLMPAAALAGKVVVIVGGTTGLGFSAAVSILGAGARGAVVTGRDPASAKAAVATLGESAVAVQGDAIDPAHAPAAIATACERFGRFVTGQVLAVDGGWSVSEGQIPSGHA